jgi:hypothetical protein
MLYCTLKSGMNRFFAVGSTLVHTAHFFEFWDFVYTFGKSLADSPALALFFVIVTASGCAIAKAKNYEDADSKGRLPGLHPCPLLDSRTLCMQPDAVRLTISAD